jgi:conjugal transfer mating pair stabilization protein TraG
VPNLIVLVAGATNLMERALSEVIDDNTTDPDAKLEFGAGGHAFDLFLNAVSPRGPITDTFLDASIKDYVRQCYPSRGDHPPMPSMTISSSAPRPISRQLCRHGRARDLQHGLHRRDKAGTTMSCTEAWDAIQTRLSDASSFDDYAPRSVSAVATTPPMPISSRAARASLARWAR